MNNRFVTINKWGIHPPGDTDGMVIKSDKTLSIATRKKTRL